MFPTPARMFLTKGVGVHRHALTAFEFALRDADIEQQNLDSRWGSVNLHHMRSGPKKMGAARGGSATWSGVSSLRDRERDVQCAAPLGVVEDLDRHWMGTFHRLVRDHAAGIEIPLVLERICRR